VLIVYNEDVPESKPLADYYAQKRGVPTNQVCAVHVRGAETITRREFNEQLRDPITRFMIRHGLLAQEPRTVEDPFLGPVPSLQTVGCRISYVVLMYGVPLRIETDATLVERAKDLNVRKEFKRDEASVESELALLPTVNYSVLGPMSNPFFESTAESFGAPLNRQMLLVGRLDGPDPATVRRMIDDALTAEYYGLQGRAYFDAQGIHEKGYEAGDQWIVASCQMFRDAGYECDLDERPEIFNRDYPMTDAAIYAGWYTAGVSGPFLRSDFQFKTGAIAYHIHSSSAASIHTRSDFWVGPLLARGAAATMGNVYEPYLQLTPHIDLFFKRLLNSGLFLEAGYGSEPALSWQTTFVGDPLYAPFKTSLDDQIARLEADKKPDVEWAYVRKVNLLLARGRSADAETLCRAKAAALSSDVLWEKCADLLHAAHRDPEAIDLYKQTISRTTDVYRSIRLTASLAAAYESSGQLPLALAAYERLTQLVPDSRNAVEYFKKVRDLASATGQKDKANAVQSRIDALVKQGEQD
jgi:uncharacterized protein (TIGR03790 family)